LGQGGVAERDDMGGEHPGVGGTRAPDRQRSNRDPARHLHDRQQRVEAAEVLLCMGTPSTGSRVMEASTPGRAAAMPAPAINTLSPRSLADLA
jgi:hypothetical protein